MSDIEWVQFLSRAREAAERIESDSKMLDEIRMFLKERTESDNRRFDEIGVFLKKWTALSQLMSVEDEHFRQTQFSARFRNEATEILYKHCC